MRLRETSDEFENIKPSNTQEKLDFVENRIKGLTHQLNFLDAEIFQRYVNQLKTTTFNDISPKEKAEGFTSFQIWSRSRTKLTMRYRIYHSLTSNDIQFLTRAYSKLNSVSNMKEKLEKRLSALRLAVKKENGTYVSRADIYKYEADLGKLIARTIEMYIPNTDVNFSSSRTKQHGWSMLNLSFKDKANPGLVLSSADQKDLKARIDKVKYTITAYLEGQDMDYPGGVRFESHTGYDTVKKKHVKTKDRGTISVRILTAEIVNYFNQSRHKR